MKPFSKPLTRQEEEKYLKEYQNGSIDAKSILIERNMRLVAHISRKYNKPGRDMEDVLSVGTIGLIKAVNSFEVSKGRLATYAAKCIENAILSQMRL